MNKAWKMGRIGLATAVYMFVSQFAYDATVAQATEFKQVAGVAQGDSLNIRSGPGRSYADVGDLHNGMVIHILNYDPSGKWAQFRHRGRLSWVSTKYLAEIQRHPAAPGQDRLGRHLVTAIPNDDPDGGLNVRSTPNRSGRLKATLPLSTPVDVKRISGDGKWSFIHSAYGRGWVRNKHLVKALPQSGGQTAPPRPQVSELRNDPRGYSLPGLYRVTGVAQGDKLWVRNRPNARSAPVNNRGPNQQISVLAWMSNGWAKVSIGQNIGYVNGRFLIRAQGGFPQGLVCAGAEPFWTLRFNSDQTLTYTKANNPNNPRVVALQATFPNQQTGAYPYTFRAGRFFGLLDQKKCSDGMSDISYAWSLKFVRSHPNGSTNTVYGCCRLR